MKRRQPGFTLIELAIVMLVLTILAAGILVPLTTNIEMKRYESTYKLLDQAKDALIGYAMTNPINISCTCKFFDAAALPPYSLDTANSSCTPTRTNVPTDIATICPATSMSPSQTITSVRHYLPCPDANNDGVEDRDPNAGNNCTASQGNLPWATLGIASIDAWGNRLYYDPQIGANASDQNSFTSPTVGIHNTSIAANTICASAANCAGANLLANQIPFVVISRGPNGKGALNANGTLIAWDAATTSADEKANLDNDGVYVSRPPSQAGSALGEFDDLVVWVSTPSLLARLCPSGGCP
jgi:prepilin-type N-terminal cleavage/methylation domain-containing protein